MLRLLNQSIQDYLTPPPWPVRLREGVKVGGGGRQRLELSRGLAESLTGLGVEPPRRLLDRSADLPGRIVAALETAERLPPSAFPKADAGMPSDIRTLAASALPARERENPFLLRMLEVLDESKDLFRIVLLGGSLGSGDYRRGWSDLDLFVVLNRDRLSSVEGLEQVREVARRIRQPAYGYQILQLHPPVYSVAVGGRMVLDRHLPRTALTEGLARAGAPELDPVWPASPADARDYLLSDIVPCVERLSQDLNSGAGLFRKTLAIHRAFSFPFALLQGLGHVVGKKASFEFVSIVETGGAFAGLSECAGLMASAYEDWIEPEDATAGLRRRLGSVLDMRIVNRILHPLERDLANSVERMASDLRGPRCAGRLEALAAEARSRLTGEG